MFDIDALTTALTILGAVAATLTLTWAIRAGEPADLGTFFGRPWELSWPRGVQEEEPQPWRLELLDRRPAASGSFRPVADDGPCRGTAEADLAA